MVSAYLLPCSTSVCRVYKKLDMSALSVICSKVAKYHKNFRSLYLIKRKQLHDSDEELRSVTCLCTWNILQGSSRT